MTLSDACTLLSSSARGVPSPFHSSPTNLFLLPYSRYTCISRDNENGRFDRDRRSFPFHNSRPHLWYIINIDEKKIFRRVRKLHQKRNPGFALQIRGSIERERERKRGRKREEKKERGEKTNGIYSLRPVSTIVYEETHISAVSSYSRYFPNHMNTIHKRTELVNLL